METTIQEIETLLSLSSNREALLESLINKRLAGTVATSEVTKEAPTVHTEEILSADATEEKKATEGRKLRTPFDLTAVFQVGAMFCKRKAIKGRAHVVVTVLKVDGIYVWFDKSFRCKGWDGSSAKQQMDSWVTRKFLEEFEPI